MDVKKLIEGLALMSVGPGKVYLGLCRLAGADGRAVTSYDNLAAEAGVNRRTVSRAMPKLEKLGLVERVREYNRRLPNVYIINGIRVV